MHLYLTESPTRTLYLVTSSQEEIQGRPSKVLVFRAAEGKASQAVVEFLPKSEVDLDNAIKLSNRMIKGCLGLISIAGGMSLDFPPSAISGLTCGYVQTSSWQLSHPRRSSVTPGLLAPDRNLLRRYTK